MDHATVTLQRVKILQIVPFLPPSMSGVGDYALILAQGLRERSGIQTTFAVSHWDAETGVKIDGFPIVYLEHTFPKLLDLLRSFDAVLLSYVGYGYEKRGCPLWLKQGLVAWKKECPGSFLLTFFHELYAFGKPWQSSFWTHPLQKSICRSIARLSNEVVTNRIASAEILGKMRGCKDVRHLPVFSNVGEPPELLPFKSRKRRLVLFGGEGWRRTALGQDCEALKAACRHCEITEAVEIGPGSTGIPVLGMEWRQLGPLPAAEVSGWLSSSLVGFLCYESSYLEKSGIFAAYAAHGLVPVLPDRCDYPNTLGLGKGRHFLTAGTERFDEDTLRAISANVFAWYQSHSIPRQIEMFGDLFHSFDRLS